MKHIYITPEGVINWIEKMPINVESAEDAIYFADLYEAELKKAKDQSLSIENPKLLEPHFFIDEDGVAFIKWEDGVLREAAVDRFYPIELDADIQKVEVFEKAQQTPKNLNRDNPIAGYMKYVARIIPKKAEEIVGTDWTLSRENMPTIDGFYYVYAFVHEDCGNVYPVHIIAECKMNQWVKPHTGYQMTYWRNLLEPPVNYLEPLK